MGSGEFWVLLTDFLWLLACIAGFYYSRIVARHANKAWQYSRGALGRQVARRQFELNRRKSYMLMAAVGLGILLGIFVIGGDARIVLEGGVIETDTRRIIYRFALVAIMVLITLALRTLWQIYELWSHK